MPSKDAARAAAAKYFVVVFIILSIKSYEAGLSANLITGHDTLYHGVGMNFSHQRDGDVRLVCRFEY